MKQRFLVVQAVEAARTVEDHVITDMREADVGSILGFGFAPFTGGTLSYIDFMGTKKFVELCHKLEAKYGSRFTPPKLLVEMAAKGETFYGRFPPKKAGGGVKSMRRLSACEGRWADQSADVRGESSTRRAPARNCAAERVDLPRKRE